jgi:alpha-tubulin suppressor-like RCC1 family protein
MSINSTTNILNTAIPEVLEGTSYSTAAPSSTAGFKPGDEWYVTPLGTQADSDNATQLWRFDGTKWVKQPGAGSLSLNPELAPVKDFKTQAEIDALAAGSPKPNDQNSYIVTDGTHKGDIATWSTSANAWLYYVPADKNTTTVTTPNNPDDLGKWQYDIVTDTWQQTVPGIVLPAPVTRVSGGMNLAFPSRHLNYNINNDTGQSLFIQNDDITAIGDNGVYSIGDATNIYGVPRKLPFSWHNLDGNTSYVPVAKYKPTFTDLDFARDTCIAVDHKGKPWLLANSPALSGMTTTPTSTVTVQSTPNRTMYPVQFFQGRDDIIISRVYVMNVNYSLPTEQTIACLDTTGRLWVTGYNVNGALGQGNQTAYNSWVQWGSLTGIVEVKISGRGIFARTSAGELYFAGMDGGRYMGGAVNAKYSTPTLVPNGTNVKSFDFGAVNGLYLMLAKNDGTLWAGGANTAGQLGFGNVVSPQIGMAQVPGITDAAYVFLPKLATSDASCILRTSGTISFTGYNNRGTFGYAPSTSATAPAITSFVTPTFGAQGTIVDVMFMYDQVVVLTNSGAAWRSGGLGAGGLGHAVLLVESFALKNSWKMLPLPEPVLAMRGFTSTTPSDGVQFLMAVRGAIGYGHDGAFKANLNYNQYNNSYREIAELRSFDHGVTVTNPLSQTI